MTIEQLLELPSTEWDKLSDAELLKYFEPYLQFTRPDRAAQANPRKLGAKEPAKILTPEQRAAIAKANAALAQFGLKI